MGQTASVAYLPKRILIPLRLGKLGDVVLVTTKLSSSASNVLGGISLDL
jgi:hypothetical protein